MAKGIKLRLDEWLIEKGYAENKLRAEALILAGKVKVGGERARSAALSITRETKLEVETPKEFVSRAGAKLQRALQSFRIDAAGRICADVGAATGGFSDVLLTHGAAKVYAIDVGYGDLAWKVRSDPRLVAIERTNARTLEALPEKVDLIAVDVSFISLRLLLPQCRKWLASRESSEIIALIKPQFEAKPEEVGEGGIVSDPSVHRRVLEEIALWLEKEEFGLCGIVNSPISGAQGNREFLMHLRPFAKMSYQPQSAIEQLFLDSSPES